MEPGLRPGATATRVDVFLCHNSLDKAFVRDVAEALELEFGIPHFLDAHAIPAGEAFLAWIEQALARSTGCAIFLGANGWGGTHLWEAEHALERSRQDAAFRVIPVLLPGVRAADMTRLGTGTVFSQLNWVDFRRDGTSEEELAKFRDALLGEVGPTGVGRAMLTPYMVRRDAQRWHGTRDRSILYRGRQLVRAEQLREVQPDLVAGSVIHAFLGACRRAQQRRWLALAGAGALSLVSIGVVALQAELARREALARYLASEARQAASADTGLLLGIEAAQRSTMRDVAGALLERIADLPHLQAMLRVEGGAPRTLAFSSDGAAVLVGTARGEVVRIDVGTRRQNVQARNLGSAVTALAVAPDGEAWIGTQDGRLWSQRPDGAAMPIARVPGAAQKYFPILAIDVAPDGQLVAVGDHEQHVAVLQRSPRTWVWQETLDAQRINSVAFDADGRQLVVASSAGRVQIFDARSGTEQSGWTTARSGEPIAARIGRRGEVGVVDKGPTWSTFRPNEQSSQRHLDEVFVSAAAIGPRRESGAIPGLRFVALGLASGDVVFTAGRVNEPLVKVRTHVSTVTAVAWADTGQWLATASEDGAVALWDMTRPSALLRRLPVAAGELKGLAYDATGRLLAVTSRENEGEVQVLDAGAWRVLAPLRAVRAPLPDPPAASDGFVSIEGSFVAQAGFDAAREALAWSSRGGIVHVTQLVDAATREVPEAGREPAALALGDGGHAVYAAGESALRYVPLTAEAPARRVKLPRSVRALAPANQPGVVHVASEDGELLTLQVDREVARGIGPPRRLPGPAGALIRVGDGETLLSAGAGGSAGNEVGLASPGGGYRALHSRRVGGAVNALAVSPDGSLLAAGDQEGQLHLWTGEGMPVATLRLARTAITALAIAPDGSRVAVADLDGDVHEMPLDRGRWLELGCAIVRRSLALSEWRRLVPGGKPSSMCADRNEMR